MSTSISNWRLSLLITGGGNDTVGESSHFLIANFAVGETARWGNRHGTTSIPNFIEIGPAVPEIQTLSFGHLGHKRHIDDLHFFNPG